MEMLVICRNCGEVQRFDLEIFEKHRMKGWRICTCNNREQTYKLRRRIANEQIKLGNIEVQELIKEDKYNTMVFGIHKGFDYKKVGNLDETI